MCLKAIIYLNSLVRWNQSISLGELSLLGLGLEFIGYLRITGALDCRLEWLCSSAIDLGPCRYFRVSVELTRDVILSLENNLSLFLTAGISLCCFLALLGPSFLLLLFLLS